MARRRKRARATPHLGPIVRCGKCGRRFGEAISISNRCTNPECEVCAEKPVDTTIVPTNKMLGPIPLEPDEDGTLVRTYRLRPGTWMYARDAEGTDGFGAECACGAHYSFRYSTIVSALESATTAGREIVLGVDIG